MDNFNQQLDCIISLLRDNFKTLDTTIGNLDTTIDSLDTTVSNLQDSLSDVLNIELNCVPNNFDSTTTTPITIICNTNKICDTITLKIDNSTIQTYSDVNSFIEDYDLAPENVLNHIITVEVSKDNKTFIKNIVISDIN